MSDMERADLFLVHRGYAKSRAEAQAAIAAGLVEADGEVVRKPAQPLRAGMAIRYQRAHPYVSRGGVKLAAALDRFPLSAKDKICLDLGASTGGFTQVLLERGARRVYAVDGGHGQLHPSLAADTRVTAQEDLDARDLTRAHIPEPVDLLVADLSFISLKLALPAPLDLAAPSAGMILLVKPQFEAGPRAVSRGGILRDAALREDALQDIRRWVSENGWHLLGTMESPISGGDGNQEYLLAAERP
jgi:23S rRNA (cytidine1920-2'-O)/16S rRNA (cytidine1409-2'-O)-methyltransferase